MKKKIVHNIILVVCFIQSVFCLLSLDGGHIEKTKASFTLPEITEENNNGFCHPGIVCNADTLTMIQNKIQNKESPWYDYYIGFSSMNTASKNYSIKNQSNDNPLKSKYSYLDYSSSFMENIILPDSQAAYMQALMYLFTGDEAYREKSIQILRLWSQLDPTEAGKVADGHIKMSFPMYYMVSAAELIKYSSSFSNEYIWTSDDEKKFIENFIKPPMEYYLADESKFNAWQNQYNYPLLGRIAADIYMNDYDDYATAVEMASWGKNAASDTIGSVNYTCRKLNDLEQYSDLDDSVIRIPEMGRDQAHAGGNIGNLTVIAYMLLSQNTKIDAQSGEISTASDSVNLFEYLDHRLLRGINIFYKYNLGYKLEWYPVSGYDVIYDQARGRAYGMTSAYYYYYSHIPELLDKEECGRYLKEAYMKSPSPKNGNIGYLVDDWIHIPDEMNGVVLDNINEDKNIYNVENRYILLKGNAQKKSDGEVSYLEVNAQKSGTEFVLTDVPTVRNRSGNSTWTFRVRTTAISTLLLKRDINSVPFSEVQLPDTNGEWRNITIDVNLKNVSYAEYPQDIQILYLKICGDDTKIDFDTFSVNSMNNNPPVYRSKSQEIVTFRDAELMNIFNAEDADNDKIEYKAVNLPESSEFKNDASFKWTPFQTGQYKFFIQADDGKSIAVKEVVISVFDSADEAINNIHKYYENHKYTSLTAKNYIMAYDNAVRLAAADEVSKREITAAVNELKLCFDNLELLTPIAFDGSFDYRECVKTSFDDGREYSLLDNDTETFSGDLFAPNNYFTMDFGRDYTVCVKKFKIQSRKYFPGRIWKASVYGSNDGLEWIRLTDTMVDVTDKMIEMPVVEKYINEKFRYFKIASETNCFNPAEFRIVGERYESKNRISSVSIRSEGKELYRAVMGDKIIVDFTTTEQIKDIPVTICNQKADIICHNDTSYSAEVRILKSKFAKCDFNINYKTVEGEKGMSISDTTDGSFIYISNNTGSINVSESVERIMDSTLGRSTAEIMTQVGYLFDNKETCSDFRTIDKGYGGYIIFEFKNKISLSKIEILPRQDKYYTRIVGVTIYGSNDMESWINLSKEYTISTKEWQLLNINDTAEYKYLKIYNNNNWYGNIAELRLFSKISDFDIKGDVNNDGVFTVADVVLLQKWLLAVPDVELYNWKAGDFYEDGRLDVFDLCLMKREFLEK